MTTDKQLLKKRFAATFRQYDSLAVVQQEICGQLDEMIGRICPGRIGRAMEVGCGTGFLTRYLLRRYPVAEWIVNDTNTAESMASGQLPVFATPALVALMEKAACDALSGTLEEGVSTVGAQINVEHLAATPLGIQAARRMARNCGGAASDELCLLVVLNTASIQLLPTTVASVRAAFGSAAPFDILPAVWISSLASVTVGLLTARLLSRRKGGPA